MAKEQFGGKTNHLAAIRLAYVGLRNRAAKVLENSLKPLILLDFMPLLWYTIPSESRSKRHGEQ